MGFVLLYLSVDLVAVTALRFFFRKVVFVALTEQIAVPCDNVISNCF